MEILDFNQSDTIYICMKAYILTRMTNSSEFFYKYFKILPKNFNDFPYFFSKTELNLLKNTFFYEDIKLNFKAELSDFSKLLENFPELNMFDKYEYVKISLLVNSRMFFTEEKGTSEYMMVPISDFFNHNFNSNAHWRYNSSTKLFEIYTTKKIKNGDEILLSYGEKGNNEYLLHYGFTIKNNKFGERSIYYFNYLENELKDIIEITEKLRKNNFELEIDFKGTKILQSFKELREIFNILETDEINKNVVYDNPISLENEEEVINTVIKILENIYKEYPTKLKVLYLLIKDDIIHLNQKEISINIMNILNVIIEEKKVIN